MMMMMMMMMIIMTMMMMINKFLSVVFTIYELACIKL